MTNNTQDFNSTLSEMWRTRPVRFPSRQNSGAWLAGIAEGIAVRYQISPVLIRLGFVVLTFFAGMGLLLYLTLLVILPRYTVPLSPAEVVFRNRRDPRYSTERTIGWIVGIILIINALGTGSALSTKDIIGVLAIAAAAYLLHQRMPEPPEDFYATAYPDPDAADAAGGAAAGGEYDVGKENTTSTTEHASPYTAAEGFETRAEIPTPPSWDPLGTAPFAWNLPDPDEAPAQGHASAAGARKRGGFGRAVRRFVIAMVVLVAVSGIAVLGLVGSDLVGGSEQSNLNAATSGTFPVDPDKQSAQYRFWMSDVELDLGTLSAESGVLKRDGFQDMELNARLSGVKLLIPEMTTAASYQVKLECTDTFMSESVCQQGTSFDVRGADWEERAADAARKDLPTVTVRVSAGLAEVTVDRR